MTLWQGSQPSVMLRYGPAPKETLIRSILTIWAWFAVFICSSLGFLTQIILIPYSLIWDRERIRAGRIFRLSAVAATKLNPLWHFGVAETPPKKIGAMVVVSNHCSHADSFLISHLPFEMKWL